MTSTKMRIRKIGDRWQVHCPRCGPVSQRHHHALSIKIADAHARRYCPNKTARTAA